MQVTKYMNKFYLIFVFLLAAYQSVIHAAPMSFKGSITSTSQVSKDFFSVESSYASSIKDSFGAKAIRAKGNGYETKLGEIFYLRKLTRINSAKSQVNLGLFTGLGLMDIKKKI